MIWGKVLLVHNLSWSLMLQMIQRAVRDDSHEENPQSIMSFGYERYAVLAQPGGQFVIATTQSPPPRRRVLDGHLRGERRHGSRR
jgi:hypothetical protein